MNGFMDATCPKCRKRFGWFGTIMERPACPRCGYQVPAQDLERDEKELAKAREEMRAELVKEQNNKKG